MKPIPLLLFLALFATSAIALQSPRAASEMVNSTMGTASITLAWNISSLANSYTLFYARDGYSPSAWADTTTLQMRISGLQLRTTYSFYVVARNSYGVSGPSNVVIYRTPNKRNWQTQ